MAIFFALEPKFRCAVAERNRASHPGAEAVVADDRAQFDAGHEVAAWRMQVDLIPGTARDIRRRQESPEAVRCSVYDVAFCDDPGFSDRKSTRLTSRHY